MNRLAWYRLLRSGLDPMAARFAWTQALIYEEKTLDDVYFRDANGDPWDAITKITVANYAKAHWDYLVNKPPSFMQRLMERDRQRL